MTDRQTLDIYAEKAGEYADLTDDMNSADPRLNAFIADIPQGGTVLDLGCGPGQSAGLMAQAGLSVTAIDPVPEMIEMAAARAGVTARVASFNDVDGEHLYDGIWANFSLLHAPREDMPRHLAAIAKALKPGGRFHIGVKTGTGSHRDKIGRLYTYYTEEELTGLLQDAGLTVFDRAEGVDAGLSGEDAHWICLAARA